MFLSFQFILKSLAELTELVDLNLSNTEDKIFLKQSMKLMYETFLKGFAERVIKVYNGGDKEDPLLIELKSLKSKLDKNLLGIEHQ